MPILNHLLLALAIFIPMSLMMSLVRFYIKKTPVLAAARQHNIDEDNKRLAKEKYPPIVRQNKIIGGLMFLPLIFIVTPFFATFETQVWWKYITDILLIYIVYDFLYYLTHRFLFHGNLFNGYFKRVHGLHHQARNPSHVDAQYVHPLEVFIGLFLLYLTIIICGLVIGDFHVISMVLCLFFYSQINVLNHTDIDLKDFPYNIATWISVRHHNHHIDMSHGNYATILLIYDKIFGTFE